MMVLLDRILNPGLDLFGLSQPYCILMSGGGVRSCDAQLPQGQGGVAGLLKGHGERQATPHS